MGHVDIVFESDGACRHSPPQLVSTVWIISVYSLNQMGHVDIVFESDGASRHSL
jgi:sorbitol-specific phosphotransferase system component IIA